MVKAKPRLVARGFKQREGVDFGETFARTVSSSCVRLLSAIACECDLDLCHFDVDQAFVQSDLEDVFLRLPKGCGDLSGKVVRLNKSLYGLKHRLFARRHLAPPGSTVDRGVDPRYFRVVPGDVARISDPPRLRIQEPVAIPPVIIPKI